MRTAIVTRAHSEGLTGWEVRDVLPGGGPAALAEVARTPADLVLLDAASGPDLAQAVVRLLLARPACRVIVLAEGREPGDPEIGDLVGVGVRDVVSGVEGVAAAVASPGTLASVLRWLPAGRQPDETAPRERERIVATPMASHPLVLAVTGLCGGAGATVAAAGIAGWLVRQRQEVVLAGAGAMELAREVSGAEGKALERLAAGRPAMEPAADPETVRALLDERRWAWIIVDTGPAILGDPGPYDPGATWVWPLPDADRTVLVLPPEGYRRVEHALRWAAGQRVQATRQATLAMRWHPRNGKRALEDAAAISYGEGWGTVDVLPIPDFGLAQAARTWPLGGAPDVRMDRAVRRLLAPLADHLRE